MRLIRPLALACLLAPVSAHAQDATASVVAPEPLKPSHFAVVGLAPNDMLNIRAQAAATGMMIGRLPAGALVVNLGCAEVKKVSWCKIADSNNPRLAGWAAKRYLKDVDMEAPAEASGDAPKENPNDTYVDPVDVLGE